MEDLVMRTFKDIKVGDVVIAYDEYSHDYNEHTIQIDNIEYDKEYATENNPNGMICYGTDLEEDEWGDDYITFVHEENFVSMAEDKE
jgi:hypothetical protein